MKLDLGNMRFGAVSSPVSIEGGCRNSDWYRWAALGKVKDGSDPYIAAEHLKQVKSDARLLAELGITEYRMGLEWARIEPEEGKFDQSVLNAYAEEIEYIKSLGINVLVTLFHFSLPVWFADMGGFENSSCTDYYIRYVSAAARRLKNLACEYITVNEPNVYALRGYALGVYPPGITKKKRAAAVLSNLAACHMLAYAKLHEIYESEGKSVRVGYANRLIIFEPKYLTSAFSRFSAKRAEKWFQLSHTPAFEKNLFRKPLKRPEGFVAPDYKRFRDFVGISYGTRVITDGRHVQVKEGAPVDGAGREIYAAGLKGILSYYAKRGLKVYITENGCAQSCEDADGNSYAMRYLYDHLKAISESKADVERYYYRSLYDGFEYLDGISFRYGLFGNDFARQKRYPRRVGKFYSDIIKSGGVTDEAYEQYVKETGYRVGEFFTE